MDSYPHFTTLRFGTFFFERLKRIGTEARHELQQLLDAQVMLALWVQVRSGWSDDEKHLRSYGLE